ncbi:MAG: signal peptidase II [Acetatifactor sp.]
MRKKNLFLAGDFLLAIVLLLLDRLTKYLAIQKLRGKESFVIIKDVFELTYLENFGTAFGLFQNKKIFILCMGIVFMAVVLWVAVRIPATKRFLPFHLCVTGILAGGIGNMIDRFLYGYVVDFFSFVLIHFPIFNVADCYIVVSVFFLLILFLFVYREEELDFLSFRRK